MVLRFRCPRAIPLAAGLAAAALGVALPLQAQTSSERPPRGQDWSFAAHIETRAFHMGLEDRIRDTGFGHTRAGGCGLFGCWDPERPSSGGADASVSAALRLRVRSGVVLGVIGDFPVSAGFAAGYHPDHGAARLDPEVGVLGVVASLESRNRARIGLGPALVRSRTRWGAGSSRASRLGVVIEAGVEIPPKSRLFVDLAGQYRWAPDVTVGPESGQGGTTFPAVDLALSHFALSVGLGMRWTWEGR